MQDMKSITQNEGGETWITEKQQKKSWSMWAEAKILFLPHTAQQGFALSLQTIPERIKQPWKT